MGIQTLGNGAISMASSLLSGNSIEAAEMAFFFGMFGGFMGANIAGKEALLRMTLPSFFIGGIGGGIYGRISKYCNPFGDFIGI